MTIVINKKKDQEKHRCLRKNIPKSVPTLSGWTKLKNRQMHGERFLRQYGVEEYVLDFYCPRLKLAIEVDGDSHYLQGAEEYDKARQEHIETFGIRFMHFTNPDVCDNLDGVCLMIYEEIETMKKWDSEA